MFVLSLLSLISALAFGADGPSILNAMDDAANKASDQFIEYQLINQEPGKKEPRQMAFSVHLRGGKVLTEFKAPADLKDTRVLVLSRTQMYIYLPAYRKVRRIASHVTQQGFMGTTYSHSDMSAGRFGDVYQAKLLQETEESWSLELTAKPDSKAPYARALLDVRKKDHLPSRLAYYDEKGTHLKTETRSDYKCDGAVCIPTVMRMEDHQRKGAWTELRMKDWKIDTAFSDDIFSVRNLQRGL